MILRLIDEKGFKKDSDCYTRANVFIQNGIQIRFVLNDARYL